MLRATPSVEVIVPSITGRCASFGQSLGSIYILRKVFGGFLKPLTPPYISKDIFIKGQLISKCLFGVFTFFQKTNENKWTSSKVEFVCSVFGRNFSLKKSFRICLTFK